MDYEQIVEFQVDCWQLIRDNVDVKFHPLVETFADMHRETPLESARLEIGVGNGPST